MSSGLFLNQIIGFTSTREYQAHLKALKRRLLAQFNQEIKKAPTLGLRA